MVQEPIPAPMPQRPNNGVGSNAPPPVVNAVQSPSGPGPTTWQEGMPILFGGGGGAQNQGGGGSGGKGGPVDGRWDVGKGVRFGGK